MTLPMGLAHHKVDDFAWIARTQVADSFLFVKTDSPFKTIQDLFIHAQANPGKLRVAATGFGTVDDVTLRFLEKKGYKMTTVPYPKPGERYAAVLGGHAEVLYEQAGTSSSTSRPRSSSRWSSLPRNATRPSPRCRRRRNWAST